MASMINDSRDPQAVMNMLSQHNPQMAQFMQTANSSGMSLKELFYQTARQHGVDPDAIVAAFN
ncbi:MAG: hypothetical protein HDT43_00655 [Ruminococcaceae bacterium]|nr:hypothetical protein [Oscillospiraceae bacterium]